MIINQISKGNVSVETYVGDVDITPLRQQSTVLNTSNKYLTEDITVRPIPNDYGLITFTAAVPTAAIIMVS